MVLLGRIAAAAAVALAAAGCSVEVEGARCETPFGPEQCPDGQACGNDHRCSAAARACAAPEARCCPAGTDGCEASPPRCGDGAILRCAGEGEGGDAVCGTWVTSQACAAGLTCRAGAGGAPACLCPLPEGTLVADAEEGSAADASPPPTGAAAGAGSVAPASCRFRALADALDTAAAQGTGAIVDAVGTFRTSLEPRPLAVAAGVTLRARPGAAAAVEVDAPGAAALLLAAGATVEDLVVRSAGGAATGDALAAACADATPVVVARVSVEHAEGAGRLGTGLRVSAPCAVTASALSVDGAEVGLAVGGVASPGAAVSVSGSTLARCGRGVELAAGALQVESSSIEESEGAGVIAAAEAGERELTIVGSRVVRNGDGGVIVESARALRLEANRVCGNDAITPRDGVYANRLVGGVALVGEPPYGALAFRSNQVFANVGDQLLVARSDGMWDLRGAAALTGCAADANTFAGYVAPGRGLFAGTAKVDARWNAWASLEPSLPSDYETSGEASTVEAGAASKEYCPRPSPLPTCD